MSQLAVTRGPHLSNALSTIYNYPPAWLFFGPGWRGALVIGYYGRAGNPHGWAGPVTESYEINRVGSVAVCVV